MLFPGLLAAPAATTGPPPLQGLLTPEFLQEARLHAQQVPKKTVLLQEGQVARHLYFVRTGCLRCWLNHEGKDLTTQFFLEDEAGASLESFLSGEPSRFTLEAIEASSFWVLPRAEFDRLLRESPAFKDWFLQLVTQRLVRSSQRMLSYIRDTPRQRYEGLLRTRPQLLQRLPLHYIASYLGITRVSLSRIKNRS